MLTLGSKEPAGAHWCPAGLVWSERKPLAVWEFSCITAARVIQVLDQITGLTVTEMEVEGPPVRFMSKKIGLTWQQQKADMRRLQLHRMETAYRCLPPSSLGSWDSSEVLTIHIRLECSHVANRMSEVDGIARKEPTSGSYVPQCYL